MKYADIRKLGLNQPLVLDTRDTPASTLQYVHARNTTLGVLVNYDNYQDSPWTGGDTPWAFALADRTPLVNADPSSRTKRFLVRVIDKVTLMPTDEWLIVMPKHILGLYSEVQQEWEQAFADAKRAQEQEEHKNNLCNIAREEAEVRTNSARESVEQSMRVILGKGAVSGVDFRASLTAKVDWSDERGTAIPRVDGQVQLSYAVYSMLMAKLYESIDAF